MKHILYCKACSKYTLLETCSCGKKTESNKPPKYSVEDKYAKYRREDKRQSRIDAGLLE